MGEEPTPDLDEVYDEPTIAALDAWRPRQGREPARPRRSILAGAVMAAALSGVRDALGDDRAPEPAVAPAPQDPDPRDRWVTLHFVAGDPQGSRVVIRPWLAPSPTAG